MENDLEKLFDNDWTLPTKVIYGGRRAGVTILRNEINRLKQENDNIKKRNEEWAKETVKQAGKIAGLEFKIDRLKQENERMSAILKGCGLGDDDCSFCGVDDAYKKLKQENEELKKAIMNNSQEDTPQKLELIPLSKWNDYFEYPTVGALRQLVFYENTNGFDKVTRRIGNRIYIKTSEFFKWVEESDKRGPHKCVK